MNSAMKLIKLVKTWRNLSSKGKKRIYSTSSEACKGHFVAYSSDHRRFALPLAYLHDNIFGGFFKMSEEKVGLSIGGPIRLPCDSVLVHYIIFFIQWPAVAVDLEKTLLNSIASTCCCSSLITFQHGHNSRQPLLCGY